MPNRIRDYDTMYNENSGNTETHIAADEMINRRNDLQDNRIASSEASGSLRNAYEEGFASASGVRNQTAESGGRIRHPENGDQMRSQRTHTSVEDENSGLADG